MQVCFGFTILMPRIRMSRNEDNIVGSFTCSNIALRVATDAAKIEEFLVYEVSDLG